MIRFVAVAAALLLALPLLADTRITSVFKPPVTGKIRMLDAQGRLEVVVPGSEVPERVPLDEIEDIVCLNKDGEPLKGDEPNPTESPLRVCLVNGDVLYGTPDNGPADDDESFILRSPRFGEILISIEMVQRIESVAAAKPNELPPLDAKQEHDVVYFAAEGNKPAQVDPKSELIRVTKDGVFLYNEILDGDNLEGNRYAWNRLRGVVCYRGVHDAYDKLLGIAVLRDGSVLRGAIRSWTDGKLEVDHKVLGKMLVLEEAKLLSLTMKNGRYQYLSDLEYAREPQERPYYLPGDFKYAEYMFKARRDQAQGGGPLSIRGKTYAKGLGVHAISRLSFDLNRGYKRLLAEVGVDDSAGDLASVEFKVYGDGKLLWESGVLRRSSGAKVLDLEVLSVSELVLEVTAADNADIQDRANWANAKVVR